MTDRIDDRASRTALDLITGAWRTQATYSAARLRLPDLIEAGLTTDADLAEATGIKEDLVHRLMRLLVQLDVFASDGLGGYRTTSVSDLLRDRPGSLREMCLLYGEEFYQAWGNAADALISDTPGFEKAYGTSLVAYLADHEEFADRFQRTMQVGHFALAKVPEVVDLSGCRLLVDIGGGRGHLLATLLAAAPEARGALVDLDYTIPLAREHLARTVGLDRVDLVGQDMYGPPLPAGGDLYVLSRVLGGQDDEGCVRVLSKVRTAMPPNGRVLILDRVLTDDAPNALAALWDLHLLMTNGGRQRTLDDYHALFARSRLVLERMADLPMETKALVAAARE
ncbi:methyltransferase [Thermomonospora umbrina]|uniref:O-methyltransferase n=1 Tax=Thermomonospora umbrina TaxID=111806 RepID=A0A3D9T822_9ACTN|nr:methyltransferase [Thermomonospora umbrina]REF00825.1 O-methyltransferase [Thermomonospora umbrina]